MLIGEVSRRSGVSTRMLRHYDTVGLGRPTGRTPGGYREYSAEDIRRLLHVESLRTLGLSLRALYTDSLCIDSLWLSFLLGASDALHRPCQLLGPRREHPGRGQPEANSGCRSPTAHDHEAGSAPH